MMVEQARTKDTKYGQSPTSDGWFVVHASEATWMKSERFGAICDFEGGIQFPEVGVNIHVVQPDQPSCLYHCESAQENFFVLSGECLLLVEGEEHRLHAGHFVHCPPWTEHVFVGAGDGPCLILMIGARPSDRKLRYPANELAASYGASVAEETTDPKQAYGSIPIFTAPVDPLWSED